jgi:hypothetical protein
MRSWIGRMSSKDAFSVSVSARALIMRNRCLSGTLRVG